MYHSNPAFTCRVIGSNVDASGNIYCAAQFRLDNTNIFYDSAILKFNSAGTLLWQKRLYTGVYSSYDGVLADGMLGDSAGNSYIIGTTYDAATTWEMWFLMKIDANGNTVWQQRLTGLSTYPTVAGNYGPSGVTVAADGSVYVAINVNSADYLHLYLVIVKYNSAGVMQWQRSLAVAGYYTAGTCITVNSAGIHITGILNQEGTYTFARNFYVNLPIDGSHTGTFVVDGFSYVYSASAFSFAAGNIQNLAGILTLAAFATMVLAPAVTSVNSGLAITSINI
jgi:hypothetical protein